jgi:hypothetical protein
VKPARKKCTKIPTKFSISLPFTSLPVSEPLSVIRVYAAILRLNSILFKTFFKTLLIFFKTPAPLGAVTCYISNTIEFEIARTSM